MYRYFDIFFNLIAGNWWCCQATSTNNKSNWWCCLATPATPDNYRAVKNSINFYFESV